MNIKIINGQVLVNDQPTKDAELIGYALLDFAESIEEDPMAIELKDQDIFIT